MSVNQWNEAPVVFMSNFSSLLFLPRPVRSVSSVSKYLLVICAVLSLSLTAQAVASKSVAVATDTNAESAAVPVFNSEAHNQVQKITLDLLAAIAANGNLLESDPETYFTAVDDVLGPVVDFNFISKVVMGRYGKLATAEQKSLFEQAFRWFSGHLCSRHG
jgi:ABC-type transporter MlaC component